MFYILFAISEILTLLTPVSADNAHPQYRINQPASLSFADETTPITPLAYPPSAHICPAPRNWFVWDYDEPWNQTWTSVPMCIVSKNAKGRSKKNTFCTFISRTFSEGRGIGVFSSVHNAEIIAQYEPFKVPESIDGMNDLIDGIYGPPPYEKKWLPGRGYGLVANRSIYRGERIMQETPTLVYDREMYSSLDEDSRIPLHWHLVYQLPDDTREELMALHIQDIGDQVDDVMRTNAFGALYTDNDLHNNVFPRISRFNHDCRPNTHYFFDVYTMAQYVHAAKDISFGEELYVSYLDAETPYEERISAAQVSWGFTCSCSICRQPPSQIRASDVRLSMIKNLKEKLNDWTEDQPDRIGMANTLIELYKMERLSIGLASAYEAAAYAYSVAGDRYGAMEAAGKAVEALTVYYGGDHSLTIDLEQLMLEPEEHRTWKYTAPLKNETATEELEVLDENSDD